jgi:hypothetical protein
VKKKYLILGPEDHNGLPMFWNSSRGDWVGRGDATVYTGDYVFSFPPRELPVGNVGNVNIYTGMVHTPKERI